MTFYVYPADGTGGEPERHLTAEDVAIARLTHDGAQYDLRRDEPIVRIVAILADGQIVIDEEHLGSIVNRDMTVGQADAVIDDLESNPMPGYEDVRFEKRDTGRQRGWQLFCTRSINDRHFKPAWAGSRLLFSVAETEAEAWAEMVPAIVIADWRNAPYAMSEADYDSMIAELAAEEAVNAAD